MFWDRLLVGSTLGIHSVDVGTEILTPESSGAASSKDHGAKINNGKAKMTAKSGKHFFSKEFATPFGRVA